MPSSFRSMADLAHCEAQRVSAEYLGSGREYRFWLLAAVRHHARAANADKLRDILNDLMGTKEDGWSPKVSFRDTFFGAPDMKMSYLPTVTVLTVHRDVT